ncbi:MAG: ATP-binding response regulator, partial [Actinomycetes bacterium]
VIGVLELASFNRFTEVQKDFLELVMESIGVNVNTIIANARTDALLEESQRLASELRARSEELQDQQAELRRSNAELEEKAELLAQQNRDIEVKNFEIEQARQEIEERAQQLALASKYKSEFLANMSHELRTPLNSLLILARLLSENPDGNLTARQVEFARTIFTAGSDLLQLINDILDLSKVEAGKMDVTPVDVETTRIVDYVEATFRPLAAEKGLTLVVEVGDTAPPRLHTDEHRLQQVLRNLLSNAVKFTDDGRVRLAISRAEEGVPFASPVLAAADEVIAFTVADTGIGIPEDRLRVIFEAFQQADGTTSRRYGGTGLGLSISREIARLLGGEIHVVSESGAGSAFTLYLPLRMGTVRDPALPGGGYAEATGHPAGRSAGAHPTAAASVTGTPAALAALTDGPVAGPAGGVPAQSVHGDTVVSGPPVAPQLLTQGEVDDDRADLEPGDRALLVAVDDEDLAKTTVRVGRERNFKVVATLSADVGLAAAEELQPDAVICGLDQVVASGTSLLDALKRDPRTRHIPIHVVAGADAADRTHAAMQAGALAVIEPPVGPERVAEALAEISDFVDRRVRRLLVVEDDATERRAITELVGVGDDVEIVAVSTAEDALAAMENGRFDCMVLDLKLPRTSGFTLLEELKKREGGQGLPVIVYTARELTRREETRLRRYAESIIVKDARSPERLLDETALFLHRVEAQLPPGKRRMIEHLRGDEEVFRGKKVLIVDDDVRNVFALTSVLEQHGIGVSYAENGREGIEVLEANPETDLVLMDIMMPEMDGYATTEAIRAMPRFARLPVIALTAKAMKGDREKSIAAGASDYITKPVDTEQLLSLMRVWLYQ